MAGLHGVEVVVFVDVEEGEETAVDPSTTLLHQVLVVLHRIGFGNCIGDVSEVVLLFGLAVDAQTQNTILSQVHIGLTVVLFLELGVQDHLEVAVLEQVRLVLFRFDESLVSIGRPRAGQHMEEAESALCVLIEEMGNDILILLRFFDGEEGFPHALGTTVLLILFFVITTALQGRELRVHTHQSRHSAHVLVDESSDQVHHSGVFGLRANVQQDDVLGVEVPAKSFEKPEMGGEFGAVEMLEAGEEFERLALEVLAGPVGVSHARIPKILVEEGDVLLDGGREIAIIGDIAAHALSVIVVNLIENSINSFLQVALRLAI
jgi:hypothetical protein